MKEWGKVTVMIEWMKALRVAVILVQTNLKNIVSFTRYDRLNEKCRDKFLQIVNVSFCSLSYRRAIWGDTCNGRAITEVKPGMSDIIAWVSFLVFLHYLANIIYCDIKAISRDCIQYFWSNYKVVFNWRPSKLQILTQ